MNTYTRNSVKRAVDALDSLEAGSCGLVDGVSLVLYAQVYGVARLLPVSAAQKWVEDVDNEIESRVISDALQSKGIF